MWLALLAELLEHVLVVARHLTRVALDPRDASTTMKHATPAGSTQRQGRVTSETPAPEPGPHLPMMWASPVSTVSCELMASKLEFSNSFMSPGRRSCAPKGYGCLRMQVSPWVSGPWGSTFSPPPSKWRRCKQLGSLLCSLLPGLQHWRER